MEVHGADLFAGGAYAKQSDPLVESSRQQQVLSGMEVESFHDAAIRLVKRVLGALFEVGIVETFELDDSFVQGFSFLGKHTYASLD